MTAQIREILFWEGKRYEMHSEPLLPFLNLRAKMELPIGFVSSSSANWRGYRGKWKLEEGKLWLLHLTGYRWRGDGKFVKSSLKEIFQTSDPVFADWYTGTLLIPYGKLQKYVHMGYESRYEAELSIAIEAGCMVFK